ncbi:hypothetical protein L2E82_07023 [Cichorium intybus]|uniref:Uncharacterized protein n=1 Tax=Cichorium intybus TaxID=13427 RepID=A0ACB9G4S6_CICIN|nr:hypothetical protein L2E82_07023 [Cichorium intybus]
MKKFIRDLGVVPSIDGPVEIFCDNEGAVALAKEPRAHKRTRHIHRKYHYIRRLVEEGDIMISRVTSEDNLADPFTKPLSQAKHDSHTRRSDIHGPLDDLVLTANCSSEPHDWPEPNQKCHFTGYPAVPGKERALLERTHILRRQWELGQS